MFVDEIRDWDVEYTHEIANKASIICVSCGY